MTTLPQVLGGCLLVFVILLIGMTLGFYMGREDCKLRGHK